MKRTMMILVIAVLMAAGPVSAQPTTIQIDVQPGDVPDENAPRVNMGDAPSGYGLTSWQGPATGKTNWHARYLLDGDALSTLFPADAATMTVGDLASISYYTKRPAGTPAGRDWWVHVYTRPTGSGDKSGWYHDRFINNYADHTDIGSWTQYSTDTGMTFQSNGWGGPVMTLAEFITNHGTEEIEMVSIQTNSAWDGFDGYIDGLEIELLNGNVGQANLEGPVPEPAGLGLIGIALLAVRKKRS